MTENINPRTVATFMSKLSEAAGKLKERERARQNMHDQLRKVKSLTGKKVTKKALDNEYHNLVDKLNEVIYKESKIIKNQRVNDERFSKLSSEKSSELKHTLEQIDKKISLAMQSESQLVAELKNRVAHLEDQLSNKYGPQISTRINSLKESLDSINNKLDDVSSREKRLEAVEEKVKDQVYQDSIRVKRIESLIQKLHGQHEEATDEKQKERLQERIETLKQKHEAIMDSIPPPEQTLPEPKEAISFQKEEPFLEPVAPKPSNSSFAHLLEGSDAPSFKHVLSKNQKPENIPPPPLPHELRKRTMWEKVKGAFKKS